MRKRKHRLCTSLLCCVLILSNVLSVGTPVYAKSLGTDSNIVTAASDEAMPSASDDGSGSVPAGSSATDPGSDLTDAAPGADDVTQTPADPGEDPGKTEDPANTGNTDQTGTPSTPDNPADPDDPGKTEDPSPSDNPADADDSDKPEDPGASDNPADPEDPGNSEAEPGADDPAGSGDEASVSDNDISDEEQSEEGYLYADQAADTSEYLTEDPQGYNLSDIEMTPGSYAADFSAVSSQYLNSSYYFQIVYTDNATLAEDFFKDSSKVKRDDITKSGFTLASFTDLNSESISNKQYNVSARFTGSGVLSPETTYYYRLVYYNYDSTENTYCCSFLTVPMQFTTKPALETSAVKITDLSIEEAGYQCAKIVWTIENPDKEALFDIQLYYTDGTENGSNSYITASEYRDKDYNIVPNKYYATVNLESNDWAKDATARLTTYIGNKEANTVTSATIPLTFQSIEDAKIELTEKTGSGSFLASLKLSPYYYVDNSVYFNLYYRQKGNTSWESPKTGYVYNSQKNADSATGTIKLENLTGKTAYEYYIEPQGALAARDFSDILGNETTPLTFTTTEIRTYTKDDFPDEVFFSYIKRQTSTTGDEITSDKLEKLTQLSYSRSNASGNISSLQGIEYIENLTYIDLEGHTITNVGGLSSLTELTNIDLAYNDLKQLPDLSGMGQLRYASFNGNMISADYITADKVPASLLVDNRDWIPNTIQSQRSTDVAVTFAPEYYKAGDTQPFLVKIEGLKKDYSRKYTLSLTIDGKTVSSDPTSYNYYDMYYIKDILKDSSGTETGITVTEGTSYPVAITLTDSYGNTWLDGKTATVSFAGDSTPVVNTQYIKPNVSYTNIRIDNLPATYTSENIAGISLTDQDGKEVGNASKDNIYAGTSYYNPYEDVFGNISISNITDNSNVSLSANVYFAKYLTAGDYKAIVSLTNPQSSSTFEKAVCVDDIAVIESLYTTSNYSDNAYDNYGDYLYLYLDGANIDPAKVYPVLYENGQAVTEFVNGSIGRYGDTYVYKLRKLDKETYWNFSGSKTFSFDFTAVQGYEYISTIKNSNKRITLNLQSRDFVTFEHYNYKKGVYEVKTDSTVANGTDVSVSVYNSNSYTEKTLMGTAEGTITDSLLSLTFRNAEGTRYEPPKDKAAYFHYTYTDQDGERQDFDHTNNSVKWYNYYDSGTSSKNSYTNMVLYQKAVLKELSMDVSIPEEKISDTSAVTAQITDGNGTSVGNSPTLSKGSGNSGYAKYTGTWSSDTGLGEGIYNIRFLLDGNSVYTTKLYVYDDAKFYMNNQWMGTWSNSSGKGVYVSFSSEQLMGNYIHDYSSKVSASQALAYWNNGKFKLELFDRLGNSVTGWKPDHASWNSSNFYLYLKDVPDGYVGFYAKISRAGSAGNADSLGIRLDNKSIYYATAYNANEQYGEWESFGGSNVWFNDTTDLNAYYGFGSYAYPVTVTITRPYDTTPVNTFTVSQATNGNFYYFTASDLKGTDPNEAYRISAVSVDGSSRSEVGYLGVSGGQSTVVHVSGVTLNKSTLNLQLEESGDLIATVKPDNATNKNVEWSSDNPAVATVNAQGKVTAVAAGTAKITVTTVDNNKTATCTVNVFNYTLDQSTLEFDLATAEGSKPKQLHVKNGDETITSNITWSSSDDSVATVTKDGIVTPVDAGTAKILAAVKNGPTLSCTVTVSNDTLTAVALSESSCELYVDTQGNAVTDEAGQLIPQKPKTKSIKLYYSPSTAKLEAVEWTTDKPAIVSVTPNADDPTRADIEALSKGTATITATVKTASDTKTCMCEVTVKAVTSAADAEKALPQGLTALTNEQLTIGEVSLDDFPGWKWLEEEKSVTLAQFAGVQQKSFAATYTNPATPDAEPYEAAIPVNFITVTGIAIQAESSTIRKDSSSELAINWIMNGPTNVTQPDMSEYVKKVAWSSDKPAVADVTTDADGKATLTAKAAGKATVKAQITFRNNKTYKAQYKITVVEGTPADIQVSEVSGFTADPSVPGTYQGKLGSDAADNNRTILAVVTGATSLTAKSNNANVAAVGKATATGEGTYTIPLTLKAAGMAKITLTANDTAKTQKDILLYVTDSKPIISEDPVTVNLQQTDGTAFMIYSGAGYQVTTAALSGENADKFSLTPDAAGTPGGYILKANANTGTGPYKLSLNVQVKSQTDPDAAVETFDNAALNVKVIDQKPKFKIKQSTKFNLFYKDWESRLEITTDEVLNSAELADCDFTLTRNENSDYTITAKQPESLTSNCDKAGTLTLTFAGYNPVKTSFTVSMEYKKPKITLAAKSATLYPNAGINRALIRLKDGKEDYLPTATPVIDGTATASLFNLTKDGDSLALTARSPETLPGSTRVTISLQEANWAEAVKLTYTVKTNKGKPSVKLGKATLQLNTNPSAASYDMAATEIMWKDGAAFDASRVSVSAADNKAKALLNKEITFRFDETKNQIIAKLNKTDPDKVIQTGSYKFKVNAIQETGETPLTVSAPLTVKIVNVAIEPGQKSKAIAISSKGSIDVLNREGTSVTVTAALKSLNGTVTGARLSGSAAHLFEIDKETPIKDNKVVIHAKSDVSLITKYAYKVKLNLTIENAEGDKFYYLTPDISLKLKQGKPKVTIAPKTTTFFSGSYNNAVARKLTVSLKGAEAPAVEKVELVNDFDGAFDKDNINYDEQNGTFTLSSTEKAVKGRSYNLQLKVTFKDQADNEKPTVVKYSVKIK